MEPPLVHSNHESSSVSSADIETTRNSNPPNNRSHSKRKRDSDDEDYLGEAQYVNKGRVFTNRAEAHAHCQMMTNAKKQKKGSS